MAIFKKTAKWITNRGLKQEAKAVREIKSMDDMPDTMEQCIFQLLQSGTPANLKASIRGFKSKQYRFKESVPISQLKEKLDDFQGFLRETWGGGDYAIEIKSVGGVVLARYSFCIDGPNLEPADKKEAGDETEKKETEIDKLVATPAAVKNLFVQGMALKESFSQRCSTAPLWISRMT